MPACSLVYGAAASFASAVTDGGGGGRIVLAGDHLLDESANFLTDELGNKLTG